MRWGRFGLIKQPRNASSSRAVGVAKEGRCGVPDPHSHSCWACDAFETPADILVWTRACTMLLCDCACRTCFECGHLRNAAASMAHAQRASMGMSAVPQAVWSTRRCIECEWRWSGVCMAVYQEHFHPVPRSTAAEPSDAPSSSVPRTSGAARREFLSRRLQTRDSCSLGLDSAGPEMSEKASFGKEHRVLSPTIRGRRKKNRTPRDNVS